MCRLAFITERFEGVKNWLSKMEKSMGGDGNGVVIGGQLLKGVNVSIDRISTMIMETTPSALFHTRRVSSGFKSDGLCHPFPCRKGFLAHNGHWDDGHNAACILDDLRVFKTFASDSQVFSYIVDKIGFERAVTRYKPDGVWLFVNKKGKLFVYKSFGSLYYSPEYDAWGSEEADEGYWYPVESGYYTPGDTPKEASWHKSGYYDTSHSPYGGYRKKSDYESTKIDTTSSSTSGNAKLAAITVYSPPLANNFAHVERSTSAKEGKSKDKLDDFHSRVTPEYIKGLGSSHTFKKEGAL